MLNPQFAPDIVEDAAGQLFRAVQAAWVADDRERLSTLVASELMDEWEKRLRDFARRGWINEICLEGPARIDYVGLQNTESTVRRYVVVRVTARVRNTVTDSHGRTIKSHWRVRDTQYLCEYWILKQRLNDFVVGSIERRLEGLHRLTEPLIPTPLHDGKTIMREAVLEHMVSPVGQDKRNLLADRTLDDVGAMILDISLTDERFAPHVVMMEICEGVETWAEAIDGDRRRFKRFATDDAVRELLYPDDSGDIRMVLRAPHVQSARIIDIDLLSSPAVMLVDVSVSGNSYQEHRVTAAVVRGKRATPVTFTTRWWMELSEDDDAPWRLIKISDASKM